MAKTTYLNCAFTNAGSGDLDELLNYLKKVGGKNLKIELRRQYAFKTSWKVKETNLLYRSHIQNAQKYLEFLRGTGSMSVDQLRIIIADLAEYVRVIDPGEDVSFIALSTNTLPSAVKFDGAQRLFYDHQIRKQYRNNYFSDLLTVYALRLSLESRLRGLLGIDFATSKGKPLGLKTLIKLAKSLKMVEYSKQTNWTEIEMVSNWLNHHMHRHLRPHPWIIHQALEVLKPFVDPKAPLIKGGRKIHSFYSATYVEDEKALELEIESNLKKKFSNIEIRWLPKREIVKA